MDTRKMKSRMNNAAQQLERANVHVQACENVSKALRIRKQIILESNVNDWEYTNKLSEFERVFLHIEKAKSESAETVPDREKLKKLVREKAKADREAAKEEEKRKRINEARYPIDD